jgi:quercetin dioxygenase-like cupin family protein
MAGDSDLTTTRMNERIFTATEAVEFSDDHAEMTQIAETSDSAVFVWGVKPGQEVAPHIHPDGQDTWVMIQGTLTYYLGDGQTKQIDAGQVDVAPEEIVHGGVNEGDDNVIFVSIHSGPEIGYKEVNR